MRSFLIWLVLTVPLICDADEVTICYNWNCANMARVSFSDEQLSVVQQLFSEVNDSVSERIAISDAIGVLELFAAQQSPTSADRGGNWDDQNVNGRMDCIDHSTNTTSYLKLFEANHWLRFYRVGERVKRVRFFGVSAHWAARIDDIQTGESFAVDSWFYDNGSPAVLYKLEDWLSGQSPDV